MHGTICREIFQNHNWKNILWMLTNLSNDEFNMFMNTHQFIVVHICTVESIKKKKKKVKKLPLEILSLC